MGFRPLVSQSVVFSALTDVERDSPSASLVLAIMTGAQEGFVVLGDLHVARFNLIEHCQKRGLPRHVAIDAIREFLESPGLVVTERISPLRGLPREFDRYTDLLAAARSVKEITHIITMSSLLRGMREYAEKPILSPEAFLALEEEEFDILGRASDPVVAPDVIELPDRSDAVPERQARPAAIDINSGTRSKETEMTPPSTVANSEESSMGA